MDLVLIRHPEVRVDAGVCYGQSDVPLRRDVRESAARLTARLQALHVPVCADAWHSSGLSRCALLASALSGAVPPRIDTRLAEMDFGAWEGRAWDTIERASIDAWAADLEHARPHGGESLAQFAERVEAWLRDIERGERSVCVIAHAGVMRVLAARMLRLERTSVLQWAIDFGGVAQFRRVRGQWVVVRWNA